MIIYQVEVVDILTTLLSWFAVIVIFALIVAAVIFFLKVYLLTELIGTRKHTGLGRQCQYCGRYTPQDSVFCKNCGGKL